MRLTVFILLYFSIAVVAYLCGIDTYATRVFDNNKTLTLDCNPANFTNQTDAGGNPIMPTDQNTIGNYVNCVDQPNAILPMFMLFLIAIGVISLVLGYSSMYIIPLIMLYAVISLVGYIFLPITFFTATLPPTLGLIINLLFNIINILMALSFIRGGQV